MANSLRTGCIILEQTQLLYISFTAVNNLSGFASLFANQYQPTANQCNIWFAESAKQHVGQGTGL